MVVSKKGKNRHYSCRECGFTSIKWLGRCPDCGAWDALEEQRLSNQQLAPVNDYVKPQPLTRRPEQDFGRVRTGIEELDRVLGGGIVAGSVILIGGDPGIGKSTLLLHMLSALASQGKRVLYVSGEESAHQIDIRAERLAALHENHYLATENSVETIIAMAAEMKPALLAVDSIQTLVSGDHASAAGSVTQVRESAARLVEIAKCTIFRWSLLVMSPRKGPWPDPAFLSIWWTRCFTSKAIETMLSDAQDRQEPVWLNQ